jgi:hypothetical protein
VRGIIAVAHPAAQYVRGNRRTFGGAVARAKGANVVSSMRVVQQHTRCEPLPERHFVEVHVRSARHTDLAAVARLLARAEPDPDAGRDVVDHLRPLLAVPSATVSVAEVDRQIVGIGVLAIRPSVRFGPSVGVIDEMWTERDEVLGTAERRQVADDIVEHLAASARNKGCTRVEVAQPLASAEPSLWKRHRFASLGRTLGRTID